MLLFLVWLGEGIRSREFVFFSLSLACTMCFGELGSSALFQRVMTMDMGGIFLVVKHCIKTLPSGG